MDNADKLKKPFVVAYYGVDYVKDPKGTNYWRNRSVIWSCTLIISCLVKFCNDAQYCVFYWQIFQEKNYISCMFSI